MDEMPNAAETIERLARESERKQFQIETLLAELEKARARIAELEAEKANA